jgi:hypothetical protein
MRVPQAQEWALEVPSPSLGSESAEAAQEPSSPGSAGRENPAPPRPPSSRSNLKPLLQASGELVRPAGRRKPGRPRIIASFYPALARVMADQTPLPKALRILGIHLDKRQIRALYRSREFSQMYQEARRQWLREWPTARSRRSKRPKRCGGGDCLGMSRELLRSV